MASTFITDCVCLPDVRIICVASTERDLRFYDISANKHSLRLHLTGLPETVSAVHYYFSQNLAVHSKLVAGDYKGTVHLFEFDAADRGPFYSSSGGGVNICRFDDVVADKTLFNYTKFFKLHKDKVTQVEYCAPLNGIFSAAEIWSKEAEVGLYLLDLGVKKGVSSFVAEKGVTCFCFDAASNILATGGPDWIVRLWSPFTPEKPFCILPGHHAGIAFIFIQDQGKKAYTIDKEKVRHWSGDKTNDLDQP